MVSDIVRWDPFREIGTMRDDLERAIARAAGAGHLPRRWSPVSDVVETDDEILITAELPGVKDEDIRITVQNGVLRISGERHLQEEVSDEHFSRIERAYGGFARSFALPPGISEGDIHASVAYGVLKISMPKPSAPEPRVIAVNPAG